jgi:hypothetical protein
MAAIATTLPKRLTAGTGTLSRRAWPPAQAAPGRRSLASAALPHPPGRSTFDGDAIVGPQTAAQVRTAGSAGVFRSLDS